MEYFWTVSAFGVSGRDAKKEINQCNTECITFSIGRSSYILMGRKKLGKQKKNTFHPISQVKKLIFQGIFQLSILFAYL